MPGEDGYELPAKFVLDLQEGKRVPAVVHRFCAVGHDRRAIGAGFNMHLSKPVEPAEPHHRRQPHSERFLDFTSA